MNVDEVAAATGLTVHEIDAMTRSGLLFTSLDNENAPSYPDAVIQTVELIRDCRQAKLTNEQIRGLLRIVGRGNTVLPWDLSTLDEIEAVVCQAAPREGPLGSLLGELRRSRP